MQWHSRQPSGLEKYMKSTWASGALELLRHADSHIELDSAFDKRIAFISVDNSVETIIRTFLSLPKSKSGIKITQKELNEAYNSFPRLLELLFHYAPDKLTGLDDGDIEHYHRIRNKLYHDGTGLSVDIQYLKAYRQIAALLLQNLFDVSISTPSPEPTLERLILLWNNLENLIRTKLMDNNIAAPNRLEWNMVSSSNIFDSNIARDFEKLRQIRNYQVHSAKLEPDRIKDGVRLAEELIKRIKS